MNNRLDFINKFIDDDSAIKEMTKCRKEFMDIDDNLSQLAIEAKDKPAMARSIANARTRLEESLQHSIKALCLKHEAE